MHRDCRCKSSLNITSICVNAHYSRKISPCLPPHALWPWKCLSEHRDDDDASTWVTLEIFPSWQFSFNMHIFFHAKSLSHALNDWVSEIDICYTCVIILLHCERPCIPHWKVPWPCKLSSWSYHIPMHENKQQSCVHQAALPDGAVIWHT